MLAALLKVLLRASEKHGAAPVVTLVENTLHAMARTPMPLAGRSLRTGRELTTTIATC
ncbi:hypothetical protein [Nonomuraea antri]|uniref:hypothetical protein n=1 Tax=Nonomuraea antri TaxID=2730852 RepID=UPI001F338BCC|nr:hypothetical protein [Nonomuraea antri]